MFVHLSRADGGLLPEQSMKPCGNPYPPVISENSHARPRSTADNSSKSCQITRPPAQRPTGRVLAGTLLFAMAFLVGISAASAQSVAFTAPSWTLGSSGTINGSGFPANGGVTLSAMHNGISVWSGSATANASGAFSTTVGVTALGFYILNVNGLPAINFSVVPVPVTTPNKPISWMAVNTHFKQHSIPSAAFVNLKNLSIDGVRDELGWATVETTPGVYDFSSYDSYVNGLYGQGLSLMFLASTYNNTVIHKDASVVGSNQTAYANFVVAALRHYSGKIFAVEVLNEPPKSVWDPAGNYLSLCQATWNAIKTASLSPYVVSCGGGGIGEGIGGDFSYQFYNAGGAAYCTGFSQHPYTSPDGPDLGYHGGSTGACNMALACSTSTSFTTSHGQTKGGWLTEYGWEAPVGSKGIREPQQAAFLVRGALCVSEYPAMHGLAAYDYQDYNDNWGMVHQDLSPKPAYQAYAVMANFLRGKTFVRHIQNDSSYLWGEVYKDTNGKYWVAAWSAEDTEADVKAGSMVDPAFVENRVSFNITLGTGPSGYNWEGQAITPTASMAVGPNPIFINTNLTSDTITLTQTAVSDGAVANGTFILTPACASDSRLDAQGLGTTNGTKVQLWYNNGGTNQKWIFTNLGNGYYEISPSYAPSLCLDVQGHGTADGTPVQLWTYAGYDNQQWRVTSVTGGYRISPAHALNECLNVTGASNVNGTQIEIATFVDDDSASIWTMK